MNIINKKIELSDGRVIEIETGKLAKQADGSVVVKMGGTMLLAAVTCAKEAKEDVDFMPLQVEYKEKFASAGRFPGGFMKREGKASDAEILTARLVDRALRPLFPDDFHAEVYVTVNLISAEKDIQPDALAGLAASSALAVSDIPFNGPISEVRVARIDGKFVINPNFSQMPNADIDIMVAATLDNIMMVEGEMKEVSEADMLEAIKFAHEEIKKHCRVQLELMEEKGTVTKRAYCHEENDEELRAAVKQYAYDRCYAIAKAGTSKQERTEAFENLAEECFAALVPDEEERETKKMMLARYYHDVEKAAMRNMILDEGVRLDGRNTEQIRPIWCEVDYLPCAHGSAIFTRGETQSLSTVTLGTKMDMKELDEVLVQGTEQFVLHYNFPPFSTGEAKAQRGVGRREIGHGNLAYRALKPMVPLGEENPYAVRVVSDILESNGSSSMATVCAGCLALMDAGVKIKKPVAGIAMGLISDSATGKYAILSDILGDEDHLGDMDFKVAGTKDGITATQMDIKVDGLSYDVLERALEQARRGRMHIMGEMLKCISEPRAEYKPHVPRIVQIRVPGEFIGAIIGKGGEVIQKIQKETNTIITITEEAKEGGVTEGVVDIFGNDKQSMDAALEWIKGIVAVPEVGKVYKGTVKSILEFGAFIEILPGKEGLLHISEIGWGKTDKVEDVLKVGDEVEVKLLEIDPKNNKMRLSRRALLEKPEGYVEPERRPRPSRRDGDKGDRRGADRGPRKPRRQGGNTQE
ncbi:polyribonucleotide nucleotidyltransferase [Muribaculum sp. An289]|uniref:Polyribonucleotide nucleotidyltransferase n=1 Tax=Candidatus Merdivivens faecigallinarum TaxID=2840871 RepID=A0A9D9J166_9BACT|nr:MULTISPECIES: polyribonucleotide nucleotidyltransferase [unclassified Muribaculum]MBO8481941.1 polyribonucleotide nucleotidyltransferase [Candidatus Merdivivens faecigallinarum]OUO38529.1 polyribonucleotide nucleotidyltransferase [Muribaculum sp. An289]OUO44020.1 polyribonucleotide nucleotidyltransferase [Muribaculum sp. An287]